MLPTLTANDFVLCYRYRKTQFDVGEMVVVQHPRFGVIIKRIEAITQQGNYVLSGDNKKVSTSSDTLGQISNSDILGKVIWHIAKP